MTLSNNEIGPYLYKASYLNIKGGELTHPEISLRLRSGNALFLIGFEKFGFGLTIFLDALVRIAP